MSKSRETSRFVEWAAGTGLGADAFVRLGRTEYQVSRLGFGTYRVALGEPEQEQALALAVASGVNLIDSSANYGDGGAERAVGAWFGQAPKGLPLKGVVVVTKAGYVQGSNLELARQRERDQQPFPEMVKYSTDCWHCIHPEFLENQISASSERLGQECLDLFLLHNPEYYFSAADVRGNPGPIASRREEFYRRIEQAFGFLEEMVKKKRIRHYGVSSNTLVLSPSDTEFVSATRLWECAEKAAERCGLERKEHHFSALQFPANLLETGAAITPNNGPDEGQTLLQFAASVDLGTLVNRPLNAIREGTLYRLAEFPSPSAPTPLSDALNEVAELEEGFVVGFGSHLKFKDSDVSAHDFFRWGTELTPERVAPLSLDHWTYLETQVVLPQTHQLIGQLDPHFRGPLEARWKDWQRGYLRALGTLLEAVRFQTTRRSREMVEFLRPALTRAMDSSWSGASIPQMVVGALMGTPGVHCVLAGMRRREYVRDLVQALKRPPQATPPELFRIFSKG